MKLKILHFGSCLDVSLVVRSFITTAQRFDFISMCALASESASEETMNISLRSWIFHCLSGNPIAVELEHIELVLHILVSGVGQDCALVRLRLVQVFDAGGPAPLGVLSELIVAVIVNRLGSLQSFHQL